MRLQFLAAFILALSLSAAYEIHIVDFAIFGSGTGGAVVSGQLANHTRTLTINGFTINLPPYQVGVYEAGPLVSDLADPDIVNSLARELEAANYGPIERNYTSVPISFRNGASMDIKRVKADGGCHDHNSALNRPGDPAAIDAWGLDGFNHSTLAPFIQQTVDYIPATTLLPLTNIQQAIRENFINKSGYPVVSDEDARYKTVVGIQRTYYTAKYINESYAQRLTTSKRYIHDNPAKGKNLHLYTRMELDRFVVNKAGRVIYAIVRDTVRNREIHVYALREYVLSGGWVDSPLALMRSGIGNCTKLEALGIKCKVDSPHVGENYRYHLAAVTLRLIDDSMKVNPLGGIPYQKSGVMVALSIQPNGTIGNTVNAMLDIRQDPYIANSINPAWGAVAMSVGLNMHDFGPGVVDLDPNNFKRPIINPRLFEGEQGAKDLDFMVDVITESRRFMDMIPFYYYEIAPGAAVNTRDGLREYIKQRVSDGAHGVGTCRRSNSPDDGVVRPDCRVWGMRNLCISDASTLPTSPAGNTNSITASAAAFDAAQIIARHELTFPQAEADEFDDDDDSN